MRATRFRRRLRSQRGASTSLIFIAVLFAIVMLFSFAYDIGHNLLVKSQLQAAADAAAIAGAYDLDLSGGTGITTPTPTAAQAYASTASVDALALCTQNFVDGKALSSSEVSTYPCQFGSPAIASTGYDSNYFMTVKTSKKITNIMACLFGHMQDTVTATAVAGPIGSPAAPTSATLPFPFAIYAPNGSAGNHSWVQQAGLETLDVGILPFLTNGSTSQFVSGPTGLLGGALAVVGTGGNGAPTIAMMKYFDPSQSTSTPPPSMTVGQTLMLMNPGLTGLNLTLFPSGPLTVENYFQSGTMKPGFLGLLSPAPSVTPALASFLQNKTFIVPVVTNPNVSILAMPLASILRGGVGAQITGFVPVRFTSSNAQIGTGLSLLGIVVLPPNFIVTGTNPTTSSASPPMNIGLAM
ncbi:MAG: hypothetical protein JST89_16490 [Cyanobacteria bacterium SZAS-4]|nr:hypothetical protein [Cyanobacteria bacterium SZAS-4]